MLWLALQACASAAARRPNLLLMMTDQQRADTLSITTTTLATPNIDRLAHEGVLFKWGYSSTPTCTPARAALLTGQSPWSHGLLGAGGIAQQYPFEMPSALASLGYSTTSIGKDHFGWVDSAYGRAHGEQAETAAASIGVLGGAALFPPDVGHGVPHGYGQTSLYDGITAENDDYHQWFQRTMGKTPETGWPHIDMNSWRGEAYAYANESLHPTAWVGSQAVAFVNDRAPFIVNASLRTAPWFLKVSFHRPHSPYDPPQRFIDATPAASLRPVYTCDPSDPLAWDATFAVNSNAHGCGPDKLDAWCGDMPANDSLFARRCYQGNIAFIDEWVGSIYTALKTTAQLEDTLILYVADHGDGQADHFHWRKSFPFEFSSHVPFLMRWPASMVGAASWPRGAHITTRVVELRDVFPTFLDAAGALRGPGAIVPANHTLQGDSLLCLLGASTAGGDASSCRGGAWRAHLDLEHSVCYNETVHWNAVFNGEMKFIFHAFWPTGDVRQMQLFNLTADPHELRDLARSNEAADRAEIDKWYQVMAQQFLAEGRDKYGFVTANGTLLQRTEGMTMSPNYPHHAPPAPAPPATSDNCSPQQAARLAEGDALMLAKDARSLPRATRPCQGFVYGSANATTTVLAALVPTAEDAAARLCISADASGGAFTLVACDLASGGISADARFVLDHNNTAPEHARPQLITHAASGSCVTATAGGSAGGAPTLGLAPCATRTAKATQQWVFGSSGRLCAAGLCITVA